MRNMYAKMCVNTTPVWFCSGTHWSHVDVPWAVAENEMDASQGQAPRPGENSHTTGFLQRHPTQLSYSGLWLQPCPRISGKSFEWALLFTDRPCVDSYPVNTHQIRHYVTRSFIHALNDLFIHSCLRFFNNQFIYPSICLAIYIFINWLIGWFINWFCIIVPLPSRITSRYYFQWGI